MVFFLVGCSSSTEVTTTTGSVVTETTSAATTASSSLATTVLDTTSTSLDPSAVVAGSLATSSANYRFTSVVLIGEDALTTIIGIVNGNTVAAEIGTGTGEVSYVRTPEGEWVTGADGEWVALEGEPPVAPPLDTLADAGSLTLESGDATRGVFTGVLGPAAGPAQGIPFSLTIEDNLVTEIRYQVDTGGDVGQVITTFSDFGGAGEVTPPEGF